MLRYASLVLILGCRSPEVRLAPDASVTVSDAAPEKCGSIVCRTGEVCCNPLMNLCAAPGTMCAQ